MYVLFKYGFTLMLISVHLLLFYVGAAMYLHTRTGVVVRILITKYDLNHAMYINMLNGVHCSTLVKFC